MEKNLSRKSPTTGNLWLALSARLFPIVIQLAPFNLLRPFSLVEEAAVGVGVDLMLLQGTKAQNAPLSLPARSYLPPAHPPANSTTLPAEPNHFTLPLKAPPALLNDLNQLPVSSPPETTAEPVIVVASSESTDSAPPPSIPTATADVNTPSSADAIVTTSYLGHPHALRSLDKALASHNVDQ